MGPLQWPVSFTPGRNEAGNRLFATRSEVIFTMPEPQLLEVPEGYKELAGFNNPHRHSRALNQDHAVASVGIWDHNQRRRI